MYPVSENGTTVFVAKGRQFVQIRCIDVGLRFRRIVLPSRAAVTLHLLRIEAHYVFEHILSGTTSILSYTRARVDAACAKAWEFRVQ